MRNSRRLNLMEFLVALMELRRARQLPNNKQNNSIGQQRRSAQAPASCVALRPALMADADPPTLQDLWTSGRRGTMSALSQARAWAYRRSLRDVCGNALRRRLPPRLSSRGSAGGGAGAGTEEERW